MSKPDEKIIIHNATVISVDDPQSGGRIKARIRGIDDNKKLEDLPYCFPALPKMIHLKPKVGENVLVLLQEQGAYGGDRFFIGPVIAQPYFMDFQSANVSKMLFNGKGDFYPLKSPETNARTYGVLPENDDIAIEGRNNSDIILKDKEVRIRCGFKDTNLGGDITNSLLANVVDPGYIQMKYKKRKDEKDKEYSSSINIVADRINILSHDSRNFFKPTHYDQSKNVNELISDDEMKKILSEMHPMIYGDDIVNFLKRLIDIFKTHVHPYDGLPPSLTSEQLSVLGEDLDRYLSKSIKIN